MSPACSVIIPCYNHAGYLPAAVRSVLGQTCDDWEAIIVDDGSTDDTAVVAHAFTDPRIHYVYQPNRGLSAARNAGIRAAQGRYLAFLDADDEWDPRFLEACQDALTASDGAAAIVTLARFIDEAGATLPRLGGHAVSAEGFRSQLVEGGFFPVHAALVRAEAVRAAGLFDEALTSLEDWDLWLRITGAGGVMRSIHEPLARYRVYPGSMSTNAGRMHANRMAVLAKLFGPPEGDPGGWPEDKRRGYGFGFRGSAFEELQFGSSEQAWLHLARAACLWPPVLARTSTYYELVCGAQPRAHRGRADMLEIDSNGAAMLEKLALLFAEAGASVREMQSAAYGHAYLALAMLSDQAGRWAQSRRYIVQAIRSDPRILGSRAVVRRLLKLSMGRGLVRALQSLQRSSRPQ